MKKLIKSIFSSSPKEKTDLSNTPTISEWWDDYARKHEKQNQEQKLGEEWNEAELIGIDVPDNQIVNYLDETVFTPFLEKAEVLLEIGPGGGRFTEILLPKCEKLIAADTSRTMLGLLKKRFENETKINYLLLDGLGIGSVKDQTVNLAFSYGVFVHLQHWDIYNYIAELNRILVPGGRAIIQHSNTFSELGWKRFIKEVKPSLNKHKLAGSFCLMSTEIIEEFVKRAGLQLVETKTDIVKRDCISLITKPNH